MGIVDTKLPKYLHVSCGLNKFLSTLFAKVHSTAEFYIPTVISVRSWNFKDGGSLKASFLANNQHATKEKSLKNSYE